MPVIVSVRMVFMLMLMLMLIVKGWTIPFLTPITVAIQLTDMGCSRGLPKANGVASCPVRLAIGLAARGFYFTSSFIFRLFCLMSMSTTACFIMEQCSACSRTVF